MVLLRALWLNGCIDKRLATILNLSSLFELSLEPWCSLIIMPSSLKSLTVCLWNKVLEGKGRKRRIWTVKFLLFKHFPSLPFRSKTSTHKYTLRFLHLFIISSTIPAHSDPLFDTSRIPMIIDWVSVLTISETTTPTLLTLVERLAWGGYLKMLLKKKNLIL